MLHGVFVADGPAGLNLEPNAWAHYRKPNAPPGSPFPAQVRFRSALPVKSAPLPEREWTQIPTRMPSRYPNGPVHYELFLDRCQAQALAALFHQRQR